MVRRYPAFLLLPVITFWVIGPTTKTKCSSKWCLNEGGSKTLAVSFLYTWINVGLSLLTHFVFFSISILPNWNPKYGPLNYISVGSILFSILLLFLIQFSKRFTCCANSCCLPTITRTVYDFENPDIVMELNANLRCVKSGQAQKIDTTYGKPFGNVVNDLSCVE